MAENAGVVLEQTGQFGSYEPPQADYAGTDTQSIYIPMRDGVRLAAEVILPAGLPADAKIPALLSQTRYWRAMELRSPFKYFLKPEALDPYFADFQPYFASRGYAIVAVDVRGTGASYGTWPLPWHEAAIEDAREIVDWIVAQRQGRRSRYLIPRHHSRTASHTESPGGKVHDPYVQPSRRVFRYRAPWRRDQRAVHTRMEPL
jgi:plasmid stabilization system protein ParE